MTWWMCTRGSAAWLALSLMGGIAHAQEGDEPIIQFDPGPARQVSAGAATGGGRLSRKKYAAAIAQGPQRVIASVELEPHMADGQFVGHEIVRFTPDGLLAKCTSLRPGDVLIAINGESLARPTQFMQAWSTLKEARALKVEILRGGQPVVVKWTISP